MTRRTLSVWVAGILTAGVATGAAMSLGTATTTQQPRDVRPNDARPATQREKELAPEVTATPGDWKNAQELARLQETRGALGEAESTLRRSIEAAPGEVARWHALAAFYNRSGQFERAVETLEAAARQNPTNPSTPHLLGNDDFAKLTDANLTTELRSSYIDRGIAAEDDALRADPNFAEALVYKNLLLRARAETEPDPGPRAALIRQADALRARTTEVRVTAEPAASEVLNLSGYPPPPPPPPAPGAGEIEWVYGETSFAPLDPAIVLKRVKYVRPVYPPMAIRLGLEGRVVIHAAIDERGQVVSARVIESIPVLNQATIDAVRQWRFDAESIPRGTGPVLISVEARFFTRK